MMVVRRHWRALLLALSVGILISDRHDVHHALDQLLRHGLLLVVLAAVLEACFDIGLIMLALAVGVSIRSLARDCGWWPTKWMAQLLPRCRDNRWARIGLGLNWFGAATLTGIFPLVALPFFLPLASAAPLMVVCLIDLVGTFALRLPVVGQTRTAKT
jgi:hypothetical protein